MVFLITFGILVHIAGINLAERLPNTPSTKGIIHSIIGWFFNLLSLFVRIAGLYIAIASLFIPQKIADLLGVVIVL